MFRKFVVLGFVAALVALCGYSDAQDKDKKRRTGTVTGELKSRKDAPTGKNVIVEVLGAGEEKARSYRVAYDPAVKGPIRKVLEAVRAAKIGDRVRLDWIEGEGFNITAFEVLKKNSEKKDDGTDKK